ncbi:hypothetical protein NQ315_010618 [Exocentrus adspersus]|uniref:Uncharacterized protein n=1 Tax=Exocentrus adspersus TaxID=1586481 RepID=A0AAV8W5I7_9CUCU|nr:hypothetical protein NQ315_010618 [Exocentrus adspersus]
MKTNLSTTNIALNEKQVVNTDNKSTSPGSSPRSSPRPSPKPQTKRDHSKSDTFLTVNYSNKDQSSFKHEGSPSKAFEKLKIAVNKLMTKIKEETLGFDLCHVVLNLTLNV